MNLSTTNDSLNADNSNVIFSKENIKQENLKISLIEKDKIILEFKQKEKNFINIINELKLSLQQKDIEISELNQEKKELEYNLEIKDKIMNQNTEKNITENNLLKNKIINYQKEIENLNEELMNKENIIKLYDENKRDK